MNPLTPRQAERRLKILATVRDQLSRFGYDGLNMRTVAESACVSPTTLYNLYDSKDSLVLAALEDHLTALGYEIASSGAEGIAHLVARAGVSSEGIMGAPRYAEAMIRLLLNSEPEELISIYLFTDSVDALERAVREMQAIGEVREDIDTARLARHMVANNWMTMMLWAKGYIALLDLREALVRSLVGTVYAFMTPKAMKKWGPLALP